MKYITEYMKNIWLIGRVIKIIQTIYRLPEIRSTLDVINQDLKSHSFAIIEIQNRINADFAIKQNNIKQDSSINNVLNLQLSTLSGKVIEANREIQKIKLMIDGK